MDVVKELAEKVMKRVESGQVSSYDWAPVFAASPPGSKGPPLRAHMARGATFVLYDYFSWDGSPTGVAEYQPYMDRVTRAWQQGRNVKSICFLATLSDEWVANMRFYWADNDAGVNFYRYLRAAQHLGIEDDWPELLPARFGPDRFPPTEPETQPEYSPSNQRHYASAPNFANAIAQQQRANLWTIANPGGVAGQFVHRINPGGGWEIRPWG